MYVPYIERDGNCTIPSAKKQKKNATCQHFIAGQKEVTNVSGQRL